MAKKKTKSSNAKTFKTQVYLNKYAEAYCNRAFGVRRVVWNWALSQFLNAKKTTGKLPEHFDVITDYRALMRAGNYDDTFEWLAKQATSGEVMSECIKDIKAAFHLARTQGAKMGRTGIKPLYKAKKDRTQTFSYFYAKDSVFRAEGSNIISISTKHGMPRCELRTAESVAWMKSSDVKLCRLTVTKKAGKYWLSISYEKLNQTNQKPVLNGKIGIDLGIVKSVVAHDGTNDIEYSFNTKASKHSDRLANRNDRQLSRMKNGSNRYEKLLLIKERRALRGANQRKDLVEKCTRFLADTYADIVIDDFSFKGALKVANPEKAYRSMVYMFKDRLASKAAETGASIRFADHAKGVKTTRKCSCCGSTQIATTRDRRMICQKCGANLDRDTNAARNCYKL